LHGSIAFVFPGQGSQSIQMLADLASTHPLVQEVFAEASDVLGEDLWTLSQNGPVEKLNQTRWTQPLMLAAGYAVYRVWEEEGGAYPDFVAGHSLGEYTALVVADALDYADAVRLVAERGRLMQEAVPEGPVPWLRSLVWRMMISSGSVPRKLRIMSSLPRTLTRPDR
jgi:(acyl-carrier-protein) S-malonyltransferase